MMSFLQCNIQSFRRNAHCVDFYLNCNSVEFDVFNEIFLSDENVSDLKVANYNLVHKFPVDGYEGVVIFIKNGILFKQIPYKSLVDILIVKKSSLRPNLIIVSCYLKPNIPIQIFCGEVQRLCDFLEGFQNVVLAGDFNSGYSQFCDTVLNSSGQTLCDIMSFS